MSRLYSLLEYKNTLQYHRGVQMNNFSNIIKEKRLAMKLSLRNASRLIGISHTYLNNLEKGVDRRTGIKNKPTPETLQLIATAYDLDYNYLLQSCGYIEETSLELPTHLQELLATCRKLPKSDVNYMTQFAQFLLEKHSPNKN